MTTDQKRGDWGKIAFGVRYSRGDAEWFWSMQRLVLSGRRRGDVHLQPAVGLPHAPACNHLVYQFLDSEADSLLMIDDDMVFEPDALERLRRSGQGVDVLSALACNRRPPHDPIVFTGWNAETNRPVIATPRQGLIEVQYVGLAFTLIRRWVLKRLFDDAGEQGPFFWKYGKGEDGPFCDDARAVGAKIAVNCDVPVGHRLTATVWWNVAEGKAEIKHNAL